MKFYTIVESFSPADGEKWDSYCKWRKKNFERFDSIDGVLRPNLFDRLADEDWEHIVNENFMLHLITNRVHAEKKKKEIEKGILLELRLDDHSPEDKRFLGFDIIDGYFDISLLTNFGNDIEFINQALGSNGLVSDLMTTESIYRKLKNEFGSDPHVEDCQIISIYKTMDEQGGAGQRR